MKNSTFQAECRKLELKIKEYMGINKARVYIYSGANHRNNKIRTCKFKKDSPINIPKVK